MDADAYLAGFGELLGCPLTWELWAQALRTAVIPIQETIAPAVFTE
jgi:hypothetical protein